MPGARPPSGWFGAVGPTLLAGGSQEPRTRWGLIDAWAGWVLHRSYGASAYQEETIGANWALVTRGRAASRRSG